MNQMHTVCISPYVKMPEKISQELCRKDLCLCYNVTFWRRNNVIFYDITINNVTLLDEPTKVCVLGTKWLLKKMRKLYVSLSFDPFFLEKKEVLGNNK